MRVVVSRTEAGAAEMPLQAAVLLELLASFTYKKVIFDFNTYQFLPS